MKKRVKSLFSYVDFLNLIKSIMKEDIEFDKFTSDIINVQFSDTYGKQNVDMFIQDSKNYNYYVFIQGREIRTTIDKYIKLVTGEELYFILPNENTNCINDSIYQTRIDELRKLVGNKFIDIYKDALLLKQEGFTRHLVSQFLVILNFLAIITI